MMSSWRACPSATTTKFGDDLRTKNSPLACSEKHRKTLEIEESHAMLKPRACNIFTVCI
jgi:hypothetical protein